MKITKINGYHLAFTLPEPLANSVQTLKSREFLLVEIVTDSGLRGWGETYSTPHASAGFIRSRAASGLLGQNPLETGRLYQTMCARMGYDRRGASIMGVAAVDIALHDIRARAQGVPVCDLLGGALRDRLFAYASAPFLKVGGDQYRDFVRDTDELLQKGYRGFKPRIGASPAADGRAMTAMRRQVGDDAALMVDVNRGYTAHAAIEAARRMDEAGLLWMEEPVTPEDIPGYQAVSRAVSFAVSGGEALGSLAAFREFFQAGTFSIAQPDPCVCGGFTGITRIAALADAFGIPVMPHVFGTLVNFYASMQAGAVLTEHRGGGPMPYPYIEVDVTYNPLLTLCGEIALNNDGTISVPRTPGLGFELDARQLEPWLTARWSESL